MKPRYSVFAFAALIIVVAIAVFVFVRNTRAIHFVDSINGIQFTLPSYVVNFADGKELTSDYQSNGSRFQFTLSQYPFTGPDTSPAFDVNVISQGDIIGVTSNTMLEEFITLHVRTRPQLTASRELVNGSWTMLCSNENPATICDAVTKLSNGKFIEFSYDVQTTKDAAGAFWSTFQDMLASTEFAS